MREPTPDCLVIDKDGDVWRHDNADGWSCLSESAWGEWDYVVSTFGPLQVFSPQTGAGTEKPATGNGGATVRPETSEVVSGPVPAPPFPRLFVLYRHVDLSNVSGTGVVAEGVVWSDHRVSLHWPGDHPSTAAWDDTEGVLAIHGHHGATELRWIDHDLPIDLWPTEGTTP